MIQTYNAVDGQSNFDVCLNTYGSLDNLYKMLQDSGVDNVAVKPASGQPFLFDDGLLAEQNITQSFLLNGVRYATSTGNYGSVYYVNQQTPPIGYVPPSILPISNPSTMYAQANNTTYVSVADGTTIITPLDKDGNSMIGCDIVQIEKEIKPFANSQYNWNKTTGIITLLAGTTVDNGETLFIIYSKIIIV